MSQQHFDSYWDKLPLELQDMVFGFTNTLTLFLNNRLKNPKRLSKKTIRQIWVDALCSNWHGDLSLLPDPITYERLRINDGNQTLTNFDLSKVTSRDLYERLCIRFPHLPKTDRVLAEIDKEYSLLIRYGCNGCNCGGYQHDINKFRLLHIPMRNMWLDLVQDLFNENPYEIALICIRHNHRDLLVYFIDTNKIRVSRFVSLEDRGTIESGKLSCMDFLARYGHLDLLIRFHDAGSRKVTEKAFNHAAENGHLDTLIWLYINYPNLVSDNVVDAAGSGGQLHVLQWLYEHHLDAFGDVDWWIPARNGHLHVIQWYHKNEFEGCMPGVMDNAAGNGHLHVVKWLHANRTEGCTDNAMDHAAVYGHLHVVKWLHENRSESCTTWAMNGAATNGQLHVVKFLHANRSEGCTVKAMNNAAGNGHIDVVEWLHENRSEGCTPYAMNCAAMNGHLHVVKWLHANRTEGCTTDAIYSSIQSGHVDVTRFLLDNRSEGFNDDAVRNSRTPEIAKLLIAKMITERRTKMMETARSEKWNQFIIDALEEGVAN